MQNMPNLWLGRICNHPLPGHCFALHQSFSPFPSSSSPSPSPSPSSSPPPTTSIILTLSIIITITNHINHSHPFHHHHQRHQSSSPLPSSSSFSPATSSRWLLSSPPKLQSQLKKKLKNNHQIVKNQERTVHTSINHRAYYLDLTIGSSSFSGQFEHTHSVININSNIG